MHIAHQLQREREGAAPAEKGGAPEEKKPVVSLPVVVPCDHATELTSRQREALKLDHRKTWNRCDHPAPPLGKLVVCSCRGCNPSCDGYEVAGEKPPAPTSG